MDRGKRFSKFLLQSSINHRREALWRAQGEFRPDMNGFGQKNTTVFQNCIVNVLYRFVGQQ